MGIGFGEELSFTTISGIPILSITSLTSITETSVNIGGAIISSSGSDISARGVCWSTSINPTIENNKTIDGIGIGFFKSSITGLIPNTTYYLRAYATNTNGTGYSERSLSFTTRTNSIIFNSNLNYGIVANIDGNEYKTIDVGSQTWMAENLRTAHYNNGTEIEYILDNTTWGSNKIGAYCWYNNDSDLPNRTTYGALYNWYTVASKSLCPIGWHVSSYDDWIHLVNYLGGVNNAATKLRETGKVHWWNIFVTDPTNESGFTALPGGYRSTIGTFSEMNFGSFWWSSSSFDSYSSFFSSIYGGTNITLFLVDKNQGLSVRCVKGDN